MKDIFKGYYDLDNDEFKSLWKKSILIFDTNVLLNLYRYQSSTRDSLLKVMETLKGRVWIPYHVGLEFQRNRLKVIAEQHKRFSEVRSIVSKSVSGMENEFEGLQLKKRHSHINPDQLIEKFKKIQEEFYKELENLEELSISVNSGDEIRDRLNLLFKGSIGPPPEKQKDIDNLFSEGDVRYKNNVPPGYKDSSKDEKDPDEFTYAGITYKRKYGDLIIWKQIIDHASQHTLKDIIFITDDSKADWWWKIESSGTKTIGVRPELRDEISRCAGVDNFHVYNTEGFLSYANKQLNARVAEEAIEEVREISVERQEEMVRSRRFRKMIESDGKSVLSRAAEFAHIGQSAEKSVYKWLSHNFSYLERNRHGSPDFVGYQDSRKFGFEIKLISNLRSIKQGLKDIIYSCNYLLNEEYFHELTLVFVVLDHDNMDELEFRIKNYASEVKSSLKVIIGKAEYNQDEGYVYDFMPYSEFYLRHQS